jgi:hypothetical protein
MHNVPKREVERRSAPRFDFPSTIEYIMDTPVLDGARKAVTIDVSNTGMKAYMFSPHPLGDQIILKAPLPIACQKATVCWINKIQDDFYMVGLKCQA